MQEVKQKILNHIKNGHVNEACTEFIRQKLPRKLRKSVQALNGRYEILKKEERRGTVTVQEFTIRFNRITSDLLDHIEAFFPEQTSERNYQQNERKNLIYWTSALLLVLTGAGTFYWYQNYFNSEKIAKVIVLPFNPLKDCTIETSSYEQQLINRYHNIIKEGSLNLDISIVSGHCAHTDDEAKSIGQMNDADLVIWGDYNEECDKDGYELAIKYSIVHNINKLCYSKDYGDTKIKKIDNLHELAEGALQEDVDRVIFSYLATLEFYNKKDHREGVSAISRIVKKYLKRMNSCDERLIGDIYSCLLGPSVGFIVSGKSINSEAYKNLAGLSTESLLSILIDYLIKCPNSESSIKIYCSVILGFLTNKNIEASNRQLYYTTAKVFLQNIKTKNNAAVIETELAKIAESDKALNLQITTLLRSQ